jgi:RNA polymerase sigma-70 factor (ECF subfamily)
MEEPQIDQLAQWYQAYGPELLLYARQITSDRAAEDVVQEAFVQLLRQSEAPEHIRAWLYRVVRNSAANMFRRLRSRALARRVERVPMQHWFESCTDDMIDAQYAQALLEALPRNQREIVVMRIWGQMTLREISELVHKPVSSVHRLYEAALETLRMKWEITPCLKNRD